MRTQQAATLPGTQEVYNECLMSKYMAERLELGPCKEKTSIYWTRKRHLTCGSNEKALKPRLFCLKNMLMSTYINIFLYSVVTSSFSSCHMPTTLMADAYEVTY